MVVKGLRYRHTIFTRRNWPPISLNVHMQCPQYNKLVTTTPSWADSLTDSDSTVPFDAML
eukprot:m.260791 g.260791  ORF g.260791 m.260791 type:complete len:60 (-) comp26651_c0_seq6:2066-2245(-)